jgi:hypothetical protein
MLPLVNFKEIRQHETSQQRAFEELCYQLVPTIHTLPAGTRLERRQTPDGGIEFSCPAPDGVGRWAWQAKYLFGLSARTYAQMDRSFLDALAVTPDLARYIFLLPTERTGRGASGQRSGIGQWQVHVDGWMAAAKDRGLNVTFEFVGHSDLLKALLDPKHAGATRYFFDKHLLDQAWFEQQTGREIANLGKRFRPEVNVDLEIGDELEAVARSDAWRFRVDEARDRVRLHDLVDPGLGDSVARSLEQARASTGLLLDQLVANWAFLVDPTQSAIDTAQAAARLAAEKLEDCQKVIRGSLSQVEPTEEHAGLRNAAYRLENELWVVQSRVTALSCLLASHDAVVLEGPAGCGKSHLLADVTRRRIARGAPTALLLGQNFEMGDPWSQIAQMLGLDLTRDELLETLSVAAAVSGKGRCLLIIDALNEHVGIDLWPDRLAGFLADLASYPWIAAVVSIRDTYLEPIVGTLPLARVHHPGLEGHEEEALERYAAHYRLRLADMPPLLPELSNPLFLGSLCRAMVAAKLEGIPRNGIGASWVFDGLIDDVENSLAKRLNFATATHPVRVAVNALASSLLLDEVDAVPWGEAQAICEAALPRGTKYSETLLWGMVSEGLLLEGADQHGSVVRFSYQRLGDHLSARELVRRAADLHELRAEVERLAGLPHAWRLRGLIEALSIVNPEQKSLELMDALGSTVGRLRGPAGAHNSRPPTVLDVTELSEHFLNGLPWRSPSSVTNRTVEMAERLVRDGLIERERWVDVLVRLACVPGHSFNVVRTDGVLARMDLATRDLAWSVYVVGDPEIPPAIDRVLRWAFRSGHTATDEVRWLAGLLLGWFLSSPDRRIRDRATKGLVRLFDAHPLDLADFVDHFGSVNDLYVLERVLAAAYGWALRHRREGERDLEAWSRILVSVFDAVFGASPPPEHLLIRHYARETVRIAAGAIQSANRSIPREIASVEPPYLSPWPLTAPARPTLEKAYGADGKWVVIGEWDDFYRYTISGAVRDFVPEGQAQLKAARARKLKRDSGQALKMLMAAFEGLPQAARARIQALLESSMQPDKDLQAISPDMAEAWRDYRQAEWRRTHPEDEVRIDPDVVARFVSRRTLDLGWTHARFGNVDKWLGQRRDRGAAPVERIGKKYAWIGLYEALGRIADHSHVQSRYGNRKAVTYQGPWQVAYAPDIDPSHLLADEAAARLDRRSGKWWIPPIHHLNSAGDDADWLRDLSDLPDLQSLLIRRDRRGRDWVPIEFHVEWQSRSDRPKTGMTEDRRELWVRTQSYLIRRGDEPRVSKWASGHNWMGLHMPMPGEWHDGYLGAYPDLQPWPVEFETHLREEGASLDGWVKATGLGPRLKLAAAHYSLDRERDFSNAEGDGRGSILPAPDLLALLGLRWSPGAYVVDDLELGENERERAWLMGSEIVGFYVGPRDDESPSVLLIRSDVLSDALVRHGLVLWTWILGEKHYWSQGDPTRQRQELYAAARLAPGGWQEWGSSADFVDHESGKRIALSNRRQRSPSEGNEPVATAGSNRGENRRIRGSARPPI